jgi:hypothetical protein
VLCEGRGSASERREGGIMQAVQILMPSNMSSRPRECLDSETALKLFASFVGQMKVWKEFEAYVLLLEDEKEISRDHVKT